MNSVSCHPGPCSQARVMDGVTKSEQGWFQDSSGLLPSKTPGPWGSETWRQPYQLLCSTRSLSVTVAGGGSRVQGWAVPGYPLPGTEVVELGNVCASLCSAEQLAAHSGLTQSDQIQAVLHDSCSKEWVRGWAFQYQAGCGASRPKRSSTFLGSSSMSGVGLRLENESLPPF